MIKLGKVKYINDPAEMANIFLEISESDENTSMHLYNTKQYNQAIYFMIQSIEKYIRYAISRKINMINPDFARKLRDMSHSFDDLLEFLIEIMSGENRNLFCQLQELIKENILENTLFNKLHNDLRYPKYIQGKEVYRVLITTKEDYHKIRDVSFKLKNCINEMINKLG
ncbi:MAG: hypothetical protein ACRC6U_10015 [Fusobacteriaceae bacterium]